MRGETVGSRSVATAGWGEASRRAVASRRAASARPEGSPHLLGEPNGGASVSSYPVTYVASVPSGGFNTDEYKTTKLVLRRMEPVIIPQEALEVIRQAHDYVDFWKVGKLNHNKEVERSIDWPKFRDNATALLDSFGSQYYIKEDLRKAV